MTLRSQPADAESERPPAAGQLRQQLEPPPGRLAAWPPGREFPGQFLQGVGWSREKQNGEQPRDTGQSSGVAQELDAFWVMGAAAGRVGEEQLACPPFSDLGCAIWLSGSSGPLQKGS